jgi:hypothetical protein
MGAQIRVYRNKIASTKSMKKIFKAMEMIATSRINKSRQGLQAARPYANALTRAVSQVATQHNVSHALTTRADEVRRSAVVIMTSDRGLAGSYSSNVLKEAEGLLELLHGEGKETKVYLIGRKAQAYFDFRSRPYERNWTGDTDNARPDRARELRKVLIEDLETAYEDGGVDEIHLVYTSFQRADRRGRPGVRGAGGARQHLRVRAEPRGVPRRRPAALHRRPTLREPGARRHQRARGPAAGDEGGRRQRRRPHQEVHAPDEQRPPGRDHHRAHRDRERRRGPVTGRPGDPASVHHEQVK